MLIDDALTHLVMKKRVLVFDLFNTMTALGEYAEIDTWIEEDQNLWTALVDTSIIKDTLNAKRSKSG